METNISNALLLLVIGMITVFVVLSLVVLCGNVLIYLVNKFSPDHIPKVKLKKPLVPYKNVAILTAVVDHVTLGKGTIQSIEKIKK